MDMLHTSQRSHNRIRAFSLIEVLVSLSIFTIVVTISVSVLMVLIDANARAQNTQTVMTNLSFALDSITRELRTGSDYYCGTAGSLPTGKDTEDTRDCADGGEAISFNEGGKSITGDSPNDSRRVGIRLNEGVIERKIGNGNWVALTSPGVRVEKLRFVVTGATRGDEQSPTATIYVAGIAGVEDGTEGYFNIQTTVVQQLLDI